MTMTRSVVAGLVEPSGGAEGEAVVVGGVDMDGVDMEFSRSRVPGGERCAGVLGSAD
ncbi:hypothetical protein [Streptomyces sp. SID13726]|uniref:hypothetical protein n=1 Tax=Streptomyces sp. SID13726 TaxID=2706058 RepID=UPI0031BB7AD1